MRHVLDVSDYGHSPGAAIVRSVVLTRAVAMARISASSAPAAAAQLKLVDSNSRDGAGIVISMTSRV